MTLRRLLDLMIALFTHFTEWSIGQPDQYNSGFFIKGKGIDIARGPAI